MADDDIRFRFDPDGTAWVSVEDLQSICAQAAERVVPRGASAAYLAIGDGMVQAAAVARSRHDHASLSAEMDAESARRRTPDAVAAEASRRRRMAASVDPAWLPSSEDVGRHG